MVSEPATSTTLLVLALLIHDIPLRNIVEPLINEKWKLQHDR